MERRIIQRGKKAVFGIVSYTKPHTPPSISERFGLEGTFKDPLVQPLNMSKIWLTRLY